MKRTTDLLNIVIENEKKARVKKEATQAEIQAGMELASQMTLFPIEARAIPNYLARCPLFSNVSAAEKSRPQFKDALLASPKGFQIYFTGVQLDQADCDIFMQIIMDCSGRTISDSHPLIINIGQCLRRTDRSDSGSNYVWLREVIERLRDAKIVIESDRYKFTGNLIREILEDKQDRQIAITLSPTIVRMFSGSEYALIDWEKRMQLKKRINLSKWLQNFICSHERGTQRHSLENLRAWFGYSSPLRKFREAMTEAMSELDRVGIISAPVFYDDNQKVSWVRL